MSKEPQTEGLHPVRNWQARNMAGAGLGRISEKWLDSKFAEPKSGTTLKHAWPIVVHIVTDIYRMWLILVIIYCTKSRFTS